MTFVKDVEIGPKLENISAFLPAQFLLSTFRAEVEEGIYVWMICLFLERWVLGSVEVRKVDPQGRLVLPAEWRGDIGDSREVILVRGPGFIKLIPKKKAHLKRFFDAVSLGVDAIGDWSEFERKFHRLHR